MTTAYIVLKSEGPHDVPTLVVPDLQERLDSGASGLVDSAAGPIKFIQHLQITKTEKAHCFQANVFEEYWVPNKALWRLVNHPHAPTQKVFAHALSFTPTPVLKQEEDDAMLFRAKLLNASEKALRLKIEAGSSQTGMEFSCWVPKSMVRQVEDGFYAIPFGMGGNKGIQPHAQ